MLSTQETVDETKEPRSIALCLGVRISDTSSRSLAAFTQPQLVLADIAVDLWVYDRWAAHPDTAFHQATAVQVRDAERSPPLPMTPTVLVASALLTAAPLSCSPE